MQYSEGFLLDGRYSLRQLVGSGSFGEVWLAHDCETDVDIAVKIYVSMDDQGLEDFRKEFQLSFELNHTNLLHASYLGVNSNDSRPYLVMPFCPDGSVAKYAGKMDEKTLWRFIRDVASGLAYLHSHTPEILHQDIKPDNILIMKNGDFVITDFGISKQLKQTLRRSARISDTAGAISYMGPERYGSNPVAVKATDIWALGVSIFELATGELPFCGQGGIMLKNGAEMPELPQEFSQNLNYVMVSCLALETWDRPAALQLVRYAESMLNGDEPVPFKKVKTRTGGIIDGRKTRRKIDENGQPNIKNTVRERADTNGNGTKMERGSSDGGRFDKRKKILIPIIAVVLVLATASFFIIHNKNVKEKERLEQIQSRNKHFIKQINEAMTDAEYYKDKADTLKEDRDEDYKAAYKCILLAKELKDSINNEVLCDTLPDLSNVEKSIRDSLLTIETLLIDQEKGLRDSGEPEIADVYKKKAQEIFELLSY